VNKCHGAPPHAPQGGLPRGLRPLDSRKEHTSLTFLTANPCEVFVWIGRKIKTFLFSWPRRWALRIASAKKLAHPQLRRGRALRAYPLRDARETGPDTLVQGMDPLAEIQSADLSGRNSQISWRNLFIR
jgi:hypothetical protein